MILLVVDDNPDIISLVSMMALRILGGDKCQIISGRNGQEGLELLQAAESMPDVIISNLRMPQMDGLTFLREVRARPQWSDIHLVMMSATQTAEARHQAAASGAEFFLAKPFNLNDFKDLLAHFFTT